MRLWPLFLSLRAIIATVLTKCPKITQNIFVDKKEEFKSVIDEESPSLEVRNGTYVGGLATKSANQFERMGFEISNIGNTTTRDFKESIIYDLTYGEKMNSLKVLKERTGANISFGLPSWLIKELSLEFSEEEKNRQQPDFILILGTQ